MTEDASNGWDAVAHQFIGLRSEIGLATVRAWAAALPKGASILDIGCGAGVPIAEGLMRDGFQVAGVDASPTLASAFHRRFPDAPIACERAEQSRFFGRQFDGAVAIGLMFLLPAEVQRLLVRRVARALKPVHGAVAGVRMGRRPHRTSLPLSGRRGVSARSGRRRSVDRKRSDRRRREPLLRSGSDSTTGR